MNDHGEVSNTVRDGVIDIAFEENRKKNINWD